jgi:exosortase/archaeosortase
VVALVLVGFGTAVLTVWSTAYRSIEAQLASALVGAFTPSRVYQNEWHVTHGGGGLWFVVTYLCTSSVLLIPLVLVGAWAITMPLVRLRSALCGLIAGSAVVIALSTVRLVMISLAWRMWGNGSLWVTHDLIGTIISLIAMSAGLGTLVVLTGTWDRRPRRHFDDPALES